jgi:hypothetical protein
MHFSSRSLADARIALRLADNIEFMFNDVQEQNREIEEGDPQAKYELRQVLGTFVLSPRLIRRSFCPFI